MAEHVYITTGGSRGGDYFHPHRCASIANSEVKEITAEEAAEAGLVECQICERHDGGVGPQAGLARRLADMHVDDVLGGDPA